MHACLVYSVAGSTAVEDVPNPATMFLFSAAACRKIVCPQFVCSEISFNNSFSKSFVCSMPCLNQGKGFVKIKDRSARIWPVYKKTGDPMLMRAVAGPLYVVSREFVLQSKEDASRD